MALAVFPLPAELRNFNPMTLFSSRRPPRRMIASAADRPRAVSAVIVVNAHVGVGDGVETTRPRRTIDCLAPATVTLKAAGGDEKYLGQIGMIKVNARVDHADHI